MTPLELQSLVDNECTSLDRRRWLQECDQKPEQWRRLALALLEEQQFTSGLRSNPFTDQVAPAVEPRRGRNVFAYTGYFLAASVLIATTWFSFRSSARNGNLESVAADSAAEKSTIQEIDLRMPKPDLMIELVNDQQESATIPIYNASKADSWGVLSQQAEMLARARQELQSRGYSMQVHPHFIQSSTQDGGQVLVPIHQVIVKPDGQ
jgi:hypothetical protein